MRLKGRLFASLIAIALTLQLVPTNALDIQASEEIGIEEVIKEEIVGFELSENVLKQEVFLHSETAIDLPEVILASVKTSEDESEPTTKEISVSWIEVNEKTYSTSESESFFV